MPEPPASSSWTTRDAVTGTSSGTNSRLSRSCGRRRRSTGRGRSVSGSSTPWPAAPSSVLFFNQDVTVAPGYFERLTATTGRFPGAVIGSAVVYAQREGLVWSAGARMEWFGRGFRVLHHGDPVEELPEEPFPVDWLFGMGTYVPAGVFERIGLPDADRFPMAWGDADFTLRARGAGIPILLDPGLRLAHEVGRYDARVAPAPTFAKYVSWLRSPIHNISLSAQREVWRRHGPKGLWRLSFALRFVFLLVNFARIRFLFRGAR